MASRLVSQRVTQGFGGRRSLSTRPRLQPVGSGGHLLLSHSHDGVPLPLAGGGLAVQATLLAGLPALMPVSCPLVVSSLHLKPSTWSAPNPM